MNTKSKPDSEKIRVGYVDPLTGMVFGGYPKGREKWMTEVQFQKMKDRYRRRAEKNKSLDPPLCKLKRGYVSESTGLLFWAYSGNKEVWTTPEKFKKKTDRENNYQKSYREKNSTKDIYNKNIEHYREYSREWSRENRIKNKEECNRKSRIAQSKARSQKMKDPSFVERQRLRLLCSRPFLKKKVRKDSEITKLLGCSVAFAKKHIESLFIGGMCWENRSKWHVDHIIPLSFAKNMKEFCVLLHYTNLQPLWASDNIKKGKKIPA
jgi:hypothetical protein